MPKPPKTKRFGPENPLRALLSLLLPYFASLGLNSICQVSVRATWRPVGPRTHRASTELCFEARWASSQSK